MTNQESELMLADLNPNQLVSYEDGSTFLTQQSTTPRQDQGLNLFASPDMHIACESFGAASNSSISDIFPYGQALNITETTNLAMSHEFIRESTNLDSMSPLSTSAAYHHWHTNGPGSISSGYVSQLSPPSDITTLDALEDHRSPFGTLQNCSIQPESHFKSFAGQDEWSRQWIIQGPDAQGLMLDTGGTAQMQRPYGHPADMLSSSLNHYMLDTVLDEYLFSSVEFPPEEECKY
jgi:hypothetical protein